MMGGHRVVKNSTYIFSARIISKIFTVFLFSIIAHKLNVNNVGIFYFAMAFSGVFGSIANFGMPNLMVRDIAKNKSNIDEYLSNILTSRLIVFLILFISFCCLNLILKNSNGVNDQVICIAGAGVFIQFYSLAPRSIFNALECMKYEAICASAESIVFFIAGTLAILLKYGLKGVSFAFLLSEISVLLLCLYFIKVKINLKLHLSFDAKNIVEIYKKSIPFALMGIFSVAYNRFDHVLINILSNINSVGLYAAAVKVLEAPIFIPMAVTTALYPFMSKYSSDEYDKLADVIYRVYRILIIIGFSISLFVVIFSKHIILILCGKEFQGAILTLKILIWTLATQYSSMLIGTALFAINKEKQVSLILVFSTCINIIMNITLIPLYLHNGAAISWITTDFISLAMQGFIAHRFKIIDVGKYIKLFMLIGVSSVISAVVYEITGSNIIWGSLIYIIYILLLLLLKILPKNDIIYIKRYIGTLFNNS
jgi:O-antigen/teichoic acid export membrane protein